MAASQIPLSSIYAFDFETTGYANLMCGDPEVHVWLWSLVNMESRAAYYGTDIDSFVNKCIELKVKLAYAHNLRFDASFLMHYALRRGIQTEQIIDGYSHAWYSFKMCGIEFRDSLKKFPMSLQSLAYAMGIPGKSEKPDFNRYVEYGYAPSWDEIRYCVQDSRIVAEAITREYNMGRMRLTASAEAFAALRATLGKDFKKKFPEISLEEDEWARPAYGGGISYLADEFAGEELYDVWVYDINSSYPSQMAGTDEVNPQYIPIGLGHLTEQPRSDQVYVVRFTSEFSLKKNHMPSLLAIRNARYASKADNFIRESEGPTEMILTSVDYQLFREQYDIDYETDHEFLAYDSEVGTCRTFIETNNRIKENAPKDSAERQAAKLNNNMAYGSFGINPHAWSVVPKLDEGGMLRYESVQDTRKCRYVPYAMFVSAYGRRQLVHAFQANYRYAVYTDTDSVHMLKPAKGLDIDDRKLGKWKLEVLENKDGEPMPFPRGKYLRSKCYCHADENRRIYKEQLKDGRWKIELKCAGVPDEAKLGLTWDTFKIGQQVSGKLAQMNCPGGVCLHPVTYTI